MHVMRAHLKVQWWMREEEEETVGRGCRMRQRSKHVARKLQVFGREMAHLKTSNTCAL